MGIGRAPEVDSPTAHALRRRSTPAGSKRFSDQIADLLAFLADRDPWTLRHLGVQAQPKGQSTPEPWLLGSSRHGATLAAHFGCAFAFGHFINPDRGAAAMRHYRRNFRPSIWLTVPRPAVCVFALCADTEQEARRLASSRDLWGLQAGRQLPGPLPSVEEAEAYTYTELDRLLIAADQRNRIVGTPEQVRDQLLDLAAEYWADEIMVLTVCFDPAARRRSYELLADAFNLRDRANISLCRAAPPASTRSTMRKAVLTDPPLGGWSHAPEPATASDQSGVWV
jgi:luciferase family oxidoreductase group 1